MFRFNLKRWVALGVASAALSLGSAGTASAQSRPPVDLKGFALQQYLNGSNRAAPVAVRPSYSSPAPIVASARPAAPAATAEPVPGTIAVRGPDGGLRNFPVEGGEAGIAQRVIVNGQVMTAVREADGSVRYVPAQNTPASVPSTQSVPGCR